MSLCLLRLYSRKSLPCQCQIPQVPNCLGTKLPGAKLARCQIFLVPFGIWGHIHRICEPRFGIFWGLRGIWFSEHVFCFGGQVVRPKWWTTQRWSVGDNTKVVNYTKVVIWHLVVNIQFLEQVWDFVAYFWQLWARIWYLGMVHLVFVGDVFGIHTWYLSFFLHGQNFWRIKFTPFFGPFFAKI